MATDCVTGLSVSGGLPRFEEPEPDHEVCDTPRPSRLMDMGEIEADKVRKVEAARWRRQFQMEATQAARITWSKRLQQTTTVYLPGTHPEFKKHVVVLMRDMRDNSAPNGSKWQAELLVSTFQMMRIQLIVEPARSLDELATLCSEKSAEEALAFATLSGIGIGQHCEAKFIALEAYNFARQARVDLENEIRRCNQCPNLRTGVKPVPTQHATIARHSHAMLHNILSHDTLHRRFISIKALSDAVNLGIMQFLTWPERHLDRMLVVEQTLASKIEK